MNRCTFRGRRESREEHVTTVVEGEVLDIEGEHAEPKQVEDFLAVRDGEGSADYQDDRDG